MHDVRARALFFIVLPLSFLFSEEVARAETPPWVKIRQTTSGGTGCPGGAVPVIVSQDRERLYLMDGTLTAEAGPNIPPAERRVFCQVTIDLDFPAGYAYAVSNEMGYKGTVALDADVTATLEVERYFAGDPPAGPTFEQAFRGPAGRRTFVAKEPAGAIGAFSSCDGAKPLHVKTTVRVSSLGDPDGAGSIRISPAWGFQVLRLHWTRCR
jgi:hypothetical protein